mmetsp:Transcript_9401/g.22254  ORF Transcript_9401/g.22254 Transcript_9401/m.22254 type:complete len:151 (-) Transcript_9401:563-1015(-)
MLVHSTTTTAFSSLSGRCGNWLPLLVGTGLQLSQDSSPKLFVQRHALIAESVLVVGGNHKRPQKSACEMFCSLTSTKPSVKLHEGLTDVLAPSSAPNTIDKNDARGLLLLDHSSRTEIAGVGLGMANPLRSACIMSPLWSHQSQGCASRS